MPARPDSSREAGSWGCWGEPSPRAYVAVETEPGYEQAAASVKASVLVTVRSEPDGDTSDVVLLGDWRETLPPFAASLSGAL